MIAAQKDALATDRRPALLRLRRRLAELFWPALTGVAFAAVLLLIFAGPAHAAPASLAGTWRVVLAHPGGGLPFGLEVGKVRGKPAAWLLNPPERLRAEVVAIEGNRLTLKFPSYNSGLVATLGADGRLRGEVHVIRRSGPLTLALTGTRDTYRFVATPKRPSADLNGHWIVTETGGTNPERGLAQFRVVGGRVSGSVQFPSGDTRYLAGEISGDQLSLSHFDGSASGLWLATLKGGVLTGEQFGAGSKAGSPWTARRAGTDSVEAVAVERPVAERIAFSFPDRTGKRVSLADARFKGKVVVVTLGGAWCPNCHDEARFVGPYATKHAREGLEVIGLQFEYGDDPARAFTQIDKFAARYGLAYPMLLAGQPTPESSKAALSSIGGVKVYPSTMFIGRDGMLREVHVGWAGPATGPLNVKAKRDFDATVTRLLRERA